LWDGLQPDAFRIEGPVGLKADPQESNPVGLKADPQKRARLWDGLQ